MNGRVFVVSICAWLVAGCGRETAQRPTATPSATAAVRTPTAAHTPTATPTPAPAATSTPTPGPRVEPVGFPIEPSTLLGLVAGDVGSRVIRWGDGPPAFDYSCDDQPSDDPGRANRCGWNARVHVEYEGQPAVDWYVPAGTPVIATMDGTATLLINTVSNPFDFYGVDREPFLGNPDRTRARVGAFPGPGGGQGVFVRIENERFRTDSAHFDISRTAPVVPSNAWLEGFDASADFATAFGQLHDFRVATPVARWEVRAGDVIGATGDSGYSEAPHLHYAIRPAGSTEALCPTTEPGFENGGWLFRSG